MTTNPTPLSRAVDRTPDVAGCYSLGIQAVKGEYRSKIKTYNPRLLTGSIDIDSATQSHYPDASRWDYGIEYNDETYFVEFHPASTTNVEEMIEKKSWLDRWLHERAPHIKALMPVKNKAYHWIATGSIKILSGSRHSRKLSAIGLLPKKIMVFK